LLRRGHVTFGSFNNRSKLGPAVVSLWAQVLHAVPGSRLLLKWHTLADEAVRRQLAAAFADLHIGADRLEMRRESPHEAMLAEYSDMDIALDPFPFSGGLTSCEALWMGVPIVTLCGMAPASRQTASFLRLVGLERLIADSPADYVRIAVELASDPETLRDLRRNLRRRMASSPLCDPATFTRHLETTYREMWHRWCRTQ
jgi:predicted O-linked N-acetylglucosamine transferase (SPINDLY family)